MKRLLPLLLALLFMLTSCGKETSEYEDLTLKNVDDYIELTDEIRDVGYEYGVPKDKAHYMKRHTIYYNNQLDPGAHFQDVEITVKVTYDNCWSLEADETATTDVFTFRVGNEVLDHEQVYFTTIYNDPILSETEAVLSIEIVEVKGQVRS